MSAIPDPENPTAGSDYTPGGFKLTGKRVLIMMLAFIATFVAVDMYMFSVARSTFGGLVTQASFREGVKYDEQIAASRSQQERGWKVDAEVAPAEGGAAVTVRAVDKDGKPVTGLAGTATFSHPADARHDVEVELKETGAGVYAGKGAPTPGAYTLILDLARNGERMFMSRNRINVGS